MRFWKENEIMFPGLTKLAKQILCVPAAATLSETVFCRAGFMVNDRRNLLKPEKLNDILFLHSNLDEATWEAKFNRTRKLSVSWTVGKRINTTGAAGEDHILAQPLKRCTASRIKPKETFELAKRDKTYSVLECAGERISFRCCQVTRKVPKTVKNLFVLQFYSWDGSFRHGEMKIWLCLYFQHVTRYFGTDFVEQCRQKCKDQKRSIFSQRVLW